MSGFLRRIASSAVRPKPNAHPFVESIYPARRNGPAESMERYETFAAPVEQAAEESFRSELPKEEIPQTNKVLAEPEEMRPQLSEIVREHKFFQPLLPQQEIESKDTSKRSRHGREESEVVTLSASPAPHQELVSSPIALGYAPLVADRFVHTGISDPREIHPLPVPGESEQASARARQGRPSPQVQPRSASPQADDIQIHIGRIEVVAVPQAAPRPAAAPARKGLSLDEYLSRRNGRAG